MRLRLIVWILLFVYPSLLNCQTSFIDNSGGVLMKDNVLTVDFCKLVKKPRTYIGKITRISTQISPFDEGLYFLNEKGKSKCVEVLGVSFANKNTRQQTEIRKSLDLIRTAKYRFRANVTIVGVLHRRLVGNYFSRVTDYEFEIIRFEKISPLIE